MELSLVNSGTEMEYAFDIPSTCSGVVTNRCDLKVVNHVFEGLDDKHQDLFLESCFRPLVHIPELKLSSQIIHHLLMRTLKSSDNEKHAVWFKFGENQARLGLQEFSLVTGLKIVDDPEYEVPERSSSLLHLFKKKRGKIMRKDLLEKFDELKKKEHANLKYKLGLITVLEHVILSAECRTLVDEKWFHLVEDLDHFNSYPWGNLSYGYTVKLFKRNTFGKIKNPKSIQYSLHGFPLAIMVWAFEALPELGRQFGEHCCIGGLPRIMCWKMDKHLRSEQLTTFFNTSEVQVRRTLQPSSDEVETSYLKDFSITLEEQEIVPDDEEEEEGEKNEAEDEDEDGEEEEEEKEEKNDTSPSNPPQPQVFDAENIRTIVREVVTEVVKDEMRIFSERMEMKMEMNMERMEMKMDMKMNNFFDRIEKLVFQAKAGPSTRATYDGANVDEEVDPEINMRDTETGRTIDGVEDTVKSPSPMPQQEMGGLNDDAGFVTCPSSAIVIYQERQLGTPMEIEKIIVDDQLESPEIEKIVVDDPVESPKGRGLRKKRPAAVLCTPYRNIEKRKKFTIVTEYDPFRPVDPAKLEDLQSWLSSSPESLEVELSSGGIANKDFFNKLVNDGWLSSEHVDEALFHIRERSKQFPLLFRQDCAILDTIFVLCVRNFFKDMSKTKRFPKALTRYATGEIPNNAKPWTDCAKLYVPFCKEGDGHWIALEIDLLHRCIYVYDSETSVLRKAQLEKQLEPIRVVVPMILTKVNAKYGDEKFGLKRLTSPSQSNGFDCGMFTIKFIEFLYAGKNVEDVDQSRISTWREKLAAEIFGAHFDP